MRSHTSKNLLNLNAPGKLKGKVKKMEILPKTNQSPWVVIDDKEKKGKKSIDGKAKIFIINPKKENKKMSV